MLEALKVFGLPVLKFRAFDLKVDLPLVGYVATHTIRVADNMTFEKLHTVLQACYNWMDYHFYDFLLFKEGDNGAEPVLDTRLVPQLNDFMDDDKERLLFGVELSEYLPRIQKILYNYDYGDGWEHYIELEQVIEACDEELPKLLDGSGDAPPEDVGGPYGFHDFLEIMKDPSHEEYVEMAEWAKSQRFEHFDLKAKQQHIRYFQR